MSPDSLASHPRDIAHFALDCASAGTGAALIFVTAVEGGSIRAPGLRMAVAADGSTRGGVVSNGCVEGDLMAQARAAITARRTTALSYGHGSGKLDIVLPCGGRIDLLVVPVGTGQMPALQDMVATERSAGTLVLTGPGGLAWHAEPGPAPAGDWRFAVHPKIRLLVIGSGPEALILAQLAAAADMSVEVISPDEGTLDRASRAGFAVQEIYLADVS